MTVQTRDVIFRFEDSCNSWCCLWSRCCIKEIDDTDPVYITPKGEIRHFDYKARGGAEANAKRTLSNIRDLLQQTAEDHNRLQAALIAIHQDLNLVLDPPDARIVNLSQLRRIERIALPILRAPSPENVPPPTPKRLVRSPGMEDLAWKQEHSEAVQED